MRAEGGASAHCVNSHRGADAPGYTLPPLRGSPRVTPCGIALRGTHRAATVRLCSSFPHSLTVAAGCSQSRTLDQHDIDVFGLDPSNGGLQIGLAVLELLIAFSETVMHVEENVGPAALRAGVIEKANAFQAQGLAIGFHVAGGVLYEIVASERSVTVGAGASHGRRAWGQGWVGGSVPSAAVERLRPSRATVYASQPAASRRTSRRGAAGLAITDDKCCFTAAQWPGTLARLCALEFVSAFAVWETAGIVPG